MKWVLICLTLLSPTFATAQDWIGPFRTTISNCWNPAGVSESVIVRFQLDQDGRISGDMMLVDVVVPTDAQIKAFQIARRAILRCEGADGYDLPRVDYEIWRNVEMAFTLPESVAGS